MWWVYAGTSSSARAEDFSENERGRHECRPTRTEQHRPPRLRGCDGSAITATATPVSPAAARSAAAALCTHCSVTTPRPGTACISAGRLSRASEPGRARGGQRVSSDVRVNIARLAARAKAAIEDSREVVARSRALREQRAAVRAALASRAQTRRSPSVAGCPRSMRRAPWRFLRLRPVSGPLV
jgi:hypothetical protein